MKFMEQAGPERELELDSGRVKPPDPGVWPDTRLIDAVRRDPPDQAALDTLVDRYWRRLFGRCRLLTLDHDRATDLAQEAWCRVLRARHALKPEGNFPAYLATTAMNIWRDRLRSDHRRGTLSDGRVHSLQRALEGDDGKGMVLADAIPDPGSLGSEERHALKQDIDHALGRLAPRLREVLVARFLVGESCAEIGWRHGRTEQTISAWVREALQEMRLYLGTTGFAPAMESES